MEVVQGLCCERVTLPRPFVALGPALVQRRPRSWTGPEPDKPKLLLQGAHPGYAAVFCFGIACTFCVLCLHF